MITIDDHCHCQHDHDHHDSGECVLCERPRVLCVVGGVWGRMGADSKVQEGVAEPRSKHQNFHTFYTDSPSYYYDHFKSSSLSLGFRKIGTQKFFEYTNNDFC